MKWADAIQKARDLEAKIGAMKMAFEMEGRTQYAKMMGDALVDARAVGTYIFDHPQED